MQLNRWDVVRWTLQAAAAAIALYYLLAYSAGCSFARGPLRGRDGIGDVAGDAAQQGRGRGLHDAGGQLEQLDAGELGPDAVAELEPDAVVLELDAGAVDAGELEQLDAGAVDAGELEQLDAAVDAGGAQCVATCQGLGYPTGKLCTPSELPGQLRCCCAAKP